MTTTDLERNSGDGHQSAAARRIKIAAVVAGYFFISISLVFVNKILLTPGASIPAPLFVTWFQCIITALICYVLGFLGEDAQEGTFLSQFPKYAYDLNIAKKILPLSVLFVGMVTFNNLCLKFVEVSFYNVARSLTIVFNVVFTYIMFQEKTSLPTIGCLVVVIAGFVVGIEGEVNFSLVGTVFGVMSSCCVSLNSIFTRRVIPHVNGNKWKLAAYNNTNAALLFLPLIAMFETSIIREHFQLLFTGLFWFNMCLGGVFGFAIGIVVILQITLTSPLTHNISGTAKSAVQTVLAIFIWQNPVTSRFALGVALVLGGSLMYAYIRSKKMAAGK